MLKLHEAIVTVWRNAASRLRRQAVARSRGRKIFDIGMAWALGILCVTSLAAAASAWWPLLETFGNLQVHFAAGCIGLLLLAVLGRSNRWAAAAAAVLMVNVASIGLRVAPVETCPIQMAATGQRAVRVLTHNLWMGNRNYAAFEHLVEQQRPDIILLQELRSHHGQMLHRLRVQYPYRATCDKDRDCGIIILSRYPLDPGRQIGGDDVMALKTVVRIDGHELVVVGTYLVQPFTPELQVVEFGGLARVVSPLPANALVAGDFNSVTWSANMTRYMAKAEVCDSNVTRATWPRWLGPFGIPIDHVFLKSEVRLLSVATFGGTGSDHRALLATVGIR